MTSPGRCSAAGPVGSPERAYWALGEPNKPSRLVRRAIIVDRAGRFGHAVS